MKQTAVEWLKKEYELSGFLTDEDFKQAKAMEEENTINFALQHMFGITDVGINLKNKYVKKYNDTFKSE
jgi:hypothetical protein